MANWNVNNIEVTTKAGDPNPAGWAITLHWDATDSAGEGEDAVSARRYGTVSMPDCTDEMKVRDLEAMDPADRYAKATEWAQEQLGEEQVAAIEASIAAELADKQNPSTKMI